MNKHMLRFLFTDRVERRFRPGPRIAGISGRREAVRYAAAGGGRARQGRRGGRSGRGDRALRARRQGHRHHRGRRRRQEPDGEVRAAREGEDGDREGRRANKAVDRSSGPRTGPFRSPSSRPAASGASTRRQGRDEILARRIGGNELDAINLLRGYVEAQQEYASLPRDESGLRQYAQKFISTAGQARRPLLVRRGRQARRADGR